MKTVFDNRQCAHVWAQQNQDEGRSSNGNLFFHGKTIYSYGYHFPLASFITRDTVFVNSDSYSVSTSKHQGYVTGAINHKQRLYVSTRVMKAFADEGRFGKATQKALSDTAIIDAQTHIEKAAKRKARKFAANDLLAAQAVIRGAEHIFTYFDAIAPKEFRDFQKTITGDNVQSVIAAEKSRLDKEEKARLKREKQAQEKLKQSCMLWAEFKEHDMPVYQSKEIFLRVNGDEIETTKGAKIPLAHGVKAFKKILAVKEKGIAWEKNGERVRVGHFEIDSIYPHYEGGQLAIIAGCHTIYWPEIERIGKQLSLI
jgi:hypothetical protein